MSTQLPILDEMTVVYRRPDGNVGWIDPERTLKTTNGSGS